MKCSRICTDVYELSAGVARIYLICHEGNLTLIDAGMQNQAESILKTIEELGFSRDDVKYILITHFHDDHIGSLKELKELTGARVFAHKKEAETIGNIQLVVPAPGLFKKLFFNLFIKGAQSKPQPELPIDETFQGGENLDFAGGLEVIATPGHSPGHTSYLIHKDGGILIVGDAATGGKMPSYPMLFFNETEAMKSLALIGSMNFSKACFSHGRTIEQDAPARFREAFHRQVL